MPELRCWRVSYYFRIGSRKREYRGYFCGCVRATTRKKAIAQMRADAEDFDNPLYKLTRMCAVPKGKGHACDAGADGGEVEVPA